MAAPPPPPPLPASQASGGPPAPPSPMNHHSQHISGSFESHVAAGKRPPPLAPQGSWSSNSAFQGGSAGLPPPREDSFSSQASSEQAPSNRSTLQSNVPAVDPNASQPVPARWSSAPGQQAPAPVQLPLKSNNRPAKPTRPKRKIEVEPEPPVVEPEPEPEPEPVAPAPVPVVLTSMLPGGVGSELPPAPVEDDSDAEPELPLTPGPTIAVKDRPSSTEAAGMNFAEFHDSQAEPTPAPAPAPAPVVAAAPAPAPAPAPPAPSKISVVAPPDFAAALAAKVQSGPMRMSASHGDDQRHSAMQGSQGSPGSDSVRMSVNVPPVNTAAAAAAHAPPAMPSPLSRGQSSPHLTGSVRESTNWNSPPLRNASSDLHKQDIPAMHVYQDPDPKAAGTAALSPRIAKKPKLVKQLSDFNQDFTAMFGSDPGPEALSGNTSTPRGREIGRPQGPPSVRGAKGGAEAQFGTPLSYLHPHQAFVSHSNYTLSLELIVSVVDGKSSAVTKHAKLGADVNITDESGRSLLHLAVYHGHESVVKKLAKAGAWMNATDKYGRSPVIVALYRGSSSMVKTLLSLGGDVNQADLDGWTPLHWAVDKGMKDGVKMILRESAFVDPQDVTGKTPLVYAVERNNSAIVKMLLAHQATTLLPDNNRRTAVSVAANRGYEGILAMCLERFYLERTGDRVVTANKAPKGSATPLDARAVAPSVDQAEPVYASGSPRGKGAPSSEDMEAALAAAAAATEATLGAMKQKSVAKVSSKQWAMTTKLKTMKSECYRQDNGCQTLGAAAQRGHTGCCAVFFSIGVEVDDRDELERTPLMMAATFNQTATALKLLEHRANTRIPDSRLETPLHWAALHGNMKLAGELIKRAADINAPNATGTTPLHLAAKHGRLDIVNLLLTQSADFRATTASGQTALDLAKAGQHTIVAEVIQQAAATGPIGSLSRVSSRISLADHSSAPTTPSAAGSGSVPSTPTGGMPARPGHAPPRRTPRA